MLSQRIKEKLAKRVKRYKEFVEMPDGEWCYIPGEVYPTAMPARELRILADLLDEHVAAHSPQYLIVRDNKS